MEKKERKKQLAKLLLLLFFLLVFFLPVTIKSGLIGDDVYNFNARGAKFFEDYDSVFSFSLDMYSGWIVRGRIFPLAFYAYCLFDVIQSVGVSDPIALYKILLVISVLINCALLYSVLKKLIGQKPAFVSILIFPVFCNMSLSHANAVYSFHMLIQNVFALSLLSLLFIEKFCECMQKEDKADKKNKRTAVVNIVLSCIFLFLSLMMYELSYVFIVFHVLIVFCYSKNVKITIKRSLPLCIIWFLCFSANMVLRNIFPQEAKYNNIDTNIPNIVTTFLKQLTGSFPIFSYCNDIKPFNLPSDLKGFFTNLDAVTIIAIILFCAVCGMVIYEIRQKELTISNKALVTSLIGGGLLAAMPAGLVSLSTEVQPRISVGVGYLPEYISSFGIAICFAALIIKLLSVLFERRKTAAVILSSALTIIGSVFLALSLFDAKATTGCYASMVNTYHRNIVKGAADYGLFDNVADSDLILGCSTTTFDVGDPPLFYSSICNRKVQAMYVNDFNEEDYADEAQAYKVIQFCTIHYTGKAYATYHIIDENGNGIVLLGEFLNRKNNSIEMTGPVKCYVYTDKAIDDMSVHIFIKNFSGEMTCLKSGGHEALYLIEQNGRDFSIDDFGYMDEIKSIRGSGTKYDPYIIADAEDLSNLAYNVNHGITYEGNYFLQTENIDLSSIPNWTPIGKFDSGNAFAGIYDGGCHYISNLNINGSVQASPNVGLFGMLAGTVCNLGIESGDISGAFIGSIASHSAPRSIPLIINCYNKAHISAYGRGGGIADNFSRGSIICCINFGEIDEAPDVITGGIVSLTANELYGCYSYTEPTSASFNGIATTTMAVSELDLSLANSQMSEVPEWMIISDIELKKWPDDMLEQQ